MLKGVSFAAELVGRENRVGSTHFFNSLGYILEKGDWIAQW